MYFDEILDHFKCGKKFRRTSWPTGVTISRNFDSINIKDLLADDWEFIETKEEKKWWKPEKRTQYYVIHGDGDVERICYTNNPSDNRAIFMGNCFKTEEEAKFMVEKLKVIHELEKFAYENNEEEIDWKNKTQCKYYLVYDTEDGELYVDYAAYCTREPLNIYFTSSKIAKKAIEEIGEDRIKKYYFNVEEA